MQWLRGRRRQTSDDDIALGLAGDDVEDLDAQIFKNLWKHHRLLPPTSTFKSRWDLVMILFVLYNSWYIPMELSFAYLTENKSAGHCAVDYAIDLCFLFDVVVNFRTTYYNGVNELVLDRKVIAKKYIASWFAVDLLAVFPFEIVVGGQFCGGEGWTASADDESSAALSALGMVKLFRLLRLGRVLKKFDKLGAANAFRIVHSMAAFLLVVNWFACAWWALGVAEQRSQDLVCADMPTEFNETPLHGCSWLERVPGRPIDKDSPFEQQYLSAMYWSVTIFMKTPWVGPDTVGEKVFACFTVVTGAVLFAALLSSVNVLVQSFGKSNAQRREKMTTLYLFSSSRSVPPELQTKLLEYADADWSWNRGLDPYQVLSYLPSHLRGDIVLSVYEDSLVHTPLFASVSTECAKTLLLRLHAQLCLPKEVLISKNDGVESLYILVRGALQVAPSAPTSGAPTRLRVMEKPGAFVGFCDASKAYAGRYPVWVSATKLTHMMVVARADFADVLDVFYEDADALNKLVAAEHRMMVESLKVEVAADSPLGLMQSHQQRAEAAPEKIDEMKQRVSHMEAELRGCVADMKEIRSHADCLPRILELLRPLEGAAIDGPTAE